MGGCFNLFCIVLSGKRPCETYKQKNSIQKLNSRKEAKTDKRLSTAVFGHRVGTTPPRFRCARRRLTPQALAIHLRMSVAVYQGCFHYRTYVSRCKWQLGTALVFLLLLFLVVCCLFVFGVCFPPNEKTSGTLLGPTFKMSSC